MQYKWCWRCEMEMPMLDDAEFALMMAAFNQDASNQGMAVVEAEARRRGQELPPPLELGRIPALRFRGFLEMYRLLTGFAEANPNAVWHHRIGQYGPDCPNCGKPLRTPKARFCAACGFGKEGLTAETKPLVERRPELFPPFSTNS